MFLIDSIRKYLIEHIKTLHLNLRQTRFAEDLKMYSKQEKDKCDDCAIKIYMFWVRESRLHETGRQQKNWTRINKINRKPVVGTRGDRGDNGERGNDLFWKRIQLPLSDLKVQNAILTK